MRTIKAEITLSKDRDAVSKVAIHSEVGTTDTHGRVSREGRDRYYAYTDYEVKDIIKKLERIIRLELSKL